MRKTNKKTIWEKEWLVLQKQEQKIVNRYVKENFTFINKNLEKIVPQKLQEKLDLAFYKAFQLVFEKGSKVIEKTYSRKKQEDEYKIREYAAEIKQNRGSARAFSKNANIVSSRNLIFSGVEGVGLGVLGIGLPDIPLFTAVILKSIYEIALSYGFSYDTHKERVFIMKLVQAALEHGEQFKELDGQINRWMEEEKIDANKSHEKISEKIELNVNEELPEQIKATAKALSRELLYMKFLQGIPIAGVVGGLSDAFYLKRITDYATHKYKKRFLINKLSNKE